MLEIFSVTNCDLAIKLLRLVTERFGNHFSLKFDNKENYSICCREDYEEEEDIDRVIQFLSGCSWMYSEMTDA